MFLKMLHSHKEKTMNLDEYKKLLLSLGKEQKNIAEINKSLEILKQEYEKATAALTSEKNKSAAEIKKTKSNIDKLKNFEVNLGELIKSLSILTKINKDNIKCVVHPCAYYCGKDKKSIKQLIELCKEQDDKVSNFEDSFEISIHSENKNTIFYRFYKKINFNETLADGTKLYENISTELEYDEYGRPFTAISLNPTKATMLKQSFNIDDFINPKGERTKLLRDAIYKTVLRENKKSKFSSNND